jgi:hypothetical protein
MEFIIVLVGLGGGAAAAAAAAVVAANRVACVRK